MIKAEIVWQAKPMDHVWRIHARIAIISLDPANKPIESPQRMSQSIKSLDLYLISSKCDHISSSNCGQLL